MASTKPVSEASIDERHAMLSAVCHDLRAPLASVTMGASFVLRVTADDEAHARSRQILEAMLRSCAQMDRLVRNFGDLAALEGNTIQLVLDNHDVATLAETSVHHHEEAAQKKNVRFDVHRPSKALQLRCDGDRMQRALDHLLDNAVRYAPNDSIVTIEASETADSIVVRVIDRGPGIPPDELPQVFERRHHAAREKRPSAGFGLSIVKGFAALHGGTLEIASIPNEATTFTVTLPKAPRTS